MEQKQQRCVFHYSLYGVSYGPALRKREPAASVNPAKHGIAVPGSVASACGLYGVRPRRTDRRHAAGTGAVYFQRRKFHIRQRIAKLLRYHAQRAGHQRRRIERYFLQCQRNPVGRRGAIGDRTGQHGLCNHQQFGRHFRHRPGGRPKSSARSGDSLRPATCTF